MHFAASKDRFAERSVRRLHAGARVQVLKGGKTLQVEADSICIVKADALVMSLPKGVRLVDADGDEILPTWGFWVTTESLDPYHLLLDFDSSR